MNRTGFVWGMAPTALADLTAHLDDFLRVRAIADYPGALNGLQLANASGTVSRVGAAVDACEATVAQAAELGCDLLVVHHGLFWGDTRPLTGGRFRLFQRALAANLAIYSAHLPLDAHPEVGNNAVLCATLGLTNPTPFFDYKGTGIGLRATVSLDRVELVTRLSAAVAGPVNVCPGGPATVREVGVITGGAGSEVAKVAAAGVDTFITGEGPHWSYPLAEELGINLLYAGHYATETFGVRALAEHLQTQYGLPWDFIAHPTGL